ncbi:hypothetical protein Lal_00022813 [Lupinus albus]|nr:hypothetical protein Lal_00022813 [Lupinus albus]
MFIDTLQPPFYDMMLGCVSLGFRKRKEGDASFVEAFNQLRSYNHPQQNYPATHKHEGTSRKRKRKSLYGAIPMSYSELLPQLVQRDLLTILPFKEVMPPYPNGFNLNACCVYHGGTAGHPTDDCNQLKGKVRDLILEGLVKFQGSVLV